MSKNKIKFFAMGGLDEIGKNLYVLEIDDKIFILDAGAKYPASNIPGVDMIIPSIKYLEDNKKRVKAYIISHGHQEESGAIPFIYSKIPAPIYCTKYTRLSIEMLNNVFEMKNKFQFVEIDGIKTMEIDGVKFGFSPLTHSIPGCVSIKVYTDQGIICYIADFICDPSAKEPFRTSYETLEFGQEGKYLALILHSQFATKSGYSIPNHRCYDLMLRYFENCKGKLFIANILQNLFNLQEILKLCEIFNKTVFIYNENNNLNAVSHFQQVLLQSRICTSKLKFGKMSEINRTREQDIVVLFLQDHNNIYETLENFIEYKKAELRIEINENDVFINNCQPVPNKETKATEILDLLYKTNAQIITIGSKQRNLIGCFEEDIKQYLTFMKPKYFIPVGAYYFQMMSAAKLALNSNSLYNYSNIFVLDNGVVVNFDEKVARPNYKDKIETGNLFIDGIDVGNVGNNVIEERARMSNDGIVLMGVSISKSKKEIFGGPDVQMRGFVFLKDSENILREITNIFLDNVKIYLSGHYDDKQIVINNIIEKCTRYVRRETGKNPVIIPQIIELN